MCQFLLLVSIIFLRPQRCFQTLLSSNIISVKFSESVSYTNAPGVEKFYGNLKLYKDSLVIHVIKPERQIYKIENDSLFIYTEKDTSIIYNKDLNKLLHPALLMDTTKFQWNELSKNTYRAVPLQDNSFTDVEITCTSNNRIIKEVKIESQDRLMDFIITDFKRIK